MSETEKMEALAEYLNPYPDTEKGEVWIEGFKTGYWQKLKRGERV